MRIRARRQTQSFAEGLALGPADGSGDSAGSTSPAGSELRTGGGWQGGRHPQRAPCVASAATGFGKAWQCGRPLQAELGALQRLFAEGPLDVLWEAEVMQVRWVLSLRGLLLKMLVSWTSVWLLTLSKSSISFSNRFPNDAPWSHLSNVSAVPCLSDGRWRARLGGRAVTVSLSNCVPLRGPWRLQRLFCSRSCP